jgi:lysylphosphatidylglycerol synthetase-like protein (DUF2156 family)
MTETHATAPPRATASPPPAPSAPPFRTRSPLRYSMRSLLILVTIIAVLAAVVPYATFWATLQIIALITLMFVGPVCLGTLALYCRGYHQTFFAGAFAGSLSMFYLSSTVLQVGNELGALVVLSVLGAAATGACACAAVATRRMAERRGWTRPAEGGEPRRGSRSEKP